MLTDIFRDLFGYEIYYIVNFETGELITRDEFYTARQVKRLQGCGMSYKELIDDLFL